MVYSPWNILYLVSFDTLTLTMNDLSIQEHLIDYEI